MPQLDHLGDSSETLGGATLASEEFCGGNGGTLGVGGGGGLGLGGLGGLGGGGNGQP